MTRSTDAAWTAGFLEGDSSEWNPAADFFGVRRKHCVGLNNLVSMWGGEVVYHESIDKFEWQLPVEEAGTFLRTIARHLCKGTQKHEACKKLYKEKK